MASGQTAGVSLPSGDKPVSRATLPNSRGMADKVLKASAVFWFLVAVSGQWFFVYYIAAFYGGPTLQGNFEAWDRNTLLIDGHIAGDPVGNWFFAAHALMAAVITFGGTLQLVPQIRKHAIAFHRWNGRLFILIAFAISLAGLYLTLIRGSTTTPLGIIGISLNGLLIMVFAAFALVYARARNIKAHRRWALRTFLVVNGVWFFRVGLFGWIIINQGPVGVGENFNGPFISIWSFANYLLPLAMLEAYLYAQERGGDTAKFTVAGLLFALTLVMAVGIFGAVMAIWLPYI